MVCWGESGSSQLSGSATGNSPSLGAQATSVVAGNGAGAGSQWGAGHSCAILEDGDGRPGGPVKCWGRGSEGQLDGNVVSDTLPVKMDLGSNTAIAIGAGWRHTCAILNDGLVKCWGDERDNGLRLGINTAAKIGSPSLRTGHRARVLSVGVDHACVILDNHKVSCWGKNNEFQLGGGNYSNRRVLEVDLGANRTARGIAAGQVHTCALLDNHEVKCWGDNTHYQLNSTNTASTSETFTLGNDSSGNPYRPTAIGAGWNHTCVLNDAGEIKCWGDNRSRQINATTDDKLTITGVGSLGADSLGESRALADAIAPGRSHTCVTVKNSGSIYCWGNNAQGQTTMAPVTEVHNKLVLIGCAAGYDDHNKEGVCKETAGGFYSPAGSNARIACSTVTPPGDATIDAISTGLSSANECWACDAGFDNTQVRLIVGQTPPGFYSEVGSNERFSCKPSLSTYTTEPSTRGWVLSVNVMGCWG